MITVTDLAQKALFADVVPAVRVLAVRRGSLPSELPAALADGELLALRASGVDGHDSIFSSISSRLAGGAA